MDRIKIFACKTMEDEIKTILPENIDYEFLDYYLHDTPSILHDELQKRIDESTDYDTLLFGYGLCSNSMVGLKSNIHTIVIPRIHDCTSLFLGSSECYLKEFRRCSGTFYISRGWIKQKGDPISRIEKYCSKYDEETRKWLIEQEYGNYKRMAFIHTLYDSEEEEYVEYTKRVAEFLNTDFVELEGSLRLFKKLVNGQWDDEFLIVDPGETITQEEFLEYPICNAQLKI